jgi:hypothetical protein
MSEFYTQIHCPLNSNYSVVVEDNGKVAYAYLYVDENIIGDVWLYNQQQAPLEERWQPEDMPFLNPVGYLKENVCIKPIKSDHDINCHWGLDPNNELLHVMLFLKEELVAKLEPNSKPGWSTLVKKNGPLAHILQ